MSEFQPAQMLAILLGASKYPKAPRFASGPPFNGSANGMLEYLRDPKGLAMPERNILDLFDDSRSPLDLLNDITSFLDGHRRALKERDLAIDFLLLYYVGHGLFPRGGEEYSLAVRSTSEDNEGASSIRAPDLAATVRGRANAKRYVLILDCCFSAKLFKEFQSGPLTLARQRLLEDFPKRGTSLFCSSNSRDASIAPQGQPYTMFSGALLEVLRSGHPNYGARFSLSELGDAVREQLRDKYAEMGVRPEVLSPDQRDGDVALIPLFPNPAYSEAETRSPGTRVARAQRVRQAESQRKAAEDANRPRKEQNDISRRAVAEKAPQVRDEAKKSAEEEENERSAWQKVETEAEKAKAEQERLVREKAQAERLAAQEAQAKKEREASELAKRQRLSREAAAKEGASQNVVETGESRSQNGEERLDEKAQAETLVLPRSEAKPPKLGYVIAGGLALIVLLVWISWSSYQRQQPSGQSSPVGSSNSAASAVNSSLLGNMAAIPHNEWTGGSPIESVELQTLFEIKQRRPLEWPRGLAFSPDGQLLASAWQEVDLAQEITPTEDKRYKGNGSIRLWNVATGELVLTLQSPGDNRPNDQYDSIAFSPDNRSLAVATDHMRPGMVQVWDVHNSRLLRTFSKEWAFHGLAFSTDGHTLAAASGDGSVYVWNLETGDLIAQLKHPDAFLSSVAFSPANPDILVAGVSDQSFCVWDFRTSTQLRVLYSKPPSIGTAVAFSPDGRTLATGDLSGQLILWDTANWKMRGIVRQGGETEYGVTDEITSIAFSSDGQILVASSGKGIVRFWDPAQRRPLGEFNHGGLAVFSPRQHLIAISNRRNSIQMMKITAKRTGD